MNLKADVISQKYIFDFANLNFNYQISSIYNTQRIILGLRFGKTYRFSLQLQNDLRDSAAGS